MANETIPRRLPGQRPARGADFLPTRFRRVPTRLGASVLTALLASCSAGPDAGRPADVAAAGNVGSVPTQTECLALAMYWEAKAEGREGMRAVGHVVLNRVADERFPSTPCAVIEEGGPQPPCQFSWYCDGRSDRPAEPEHWRTAQDLAQRLQSETFRDSTRGALFFHAKRLKNPWRIKRTRTVEIGNHVFYR